MNWNCQNCETANSLSDTACKTCTARRPWQSSARAYIVSLPSLVLITALVGATVYARALALGRFEARAEVTAAARRESALQVELADTRAELERSRTEFAQVQQNLSTTVSKVNDLDKQRGDLVRIIVDLKQIAKIPVERLPQQFKVEARSMYVENQCSSNVRAAIKYLAEDGNWPTYAFWDFPPGKWRLTLRTEQGGSIDARIAWSLVYAYAKSKDGTWVYQGTDGEIERVKDGDSFLALKALVLPIDPDGNYVWTFCQ